MARKRTNIEIEDTYLRIVMDRYGLRTMTEAVDLALRHLAGQPMSREEALASWKTGVDREQTSLKNAHGKKGYKGVLCDNRLPAGGNKKQWRWFIIDPEPSDIRAGLTTALDPATLFPQGGHGGGMQTPAGASAAGYPS